MALERKKRAQERARAAGTTVSSATAGLTTSMESVAQPDTPSISMTTTTTTNKSSEKAGEPMETDTTGN